MEDQNDEPNRREAYRLAPERVMQPMLSILCAGKRLTASRVIDVTLGGARVEFEGKQHEAIVPGREVTASVQAPGLDGWADLPARVVFSAVRRQRCVVGLVFTARPDLSDRATGAFFSVFNRRELEREPVPAEQVSAQLFPEDTETAPVPVEVLNHSPKGLGFVVDRALDELLRDRDSVPLAVSRPEGGEQTTVELRICHRATRTDAVYYGGVFA